MKLQPLSSTENPSYPQRMGRWSQALRAVKRFGAVASASALLAFSAGCTISTPGRSLDPVDAGDGGVVTDAGDGGVVTDAGDGGVVTDAGDGGVVTDSDVPLRTFELCAVDHRMSGDIAVPEVPFACDHELTPEAPSFDVPLWEFGETCEDADDAAWSTFELTEAAQIAVSFPNGGGGVSLDLYGPEGDHVIQLTPDLPCVAFEAEAGEWAMEITDVEPDEGRVHWFEIAVDIVED